MCLKCFTIFTSLAVNSEVSSLELHSLNKNFTLYNSNRVKNDLYTSDNLF